MIQFIKNLTESNDNLASTMKKLMEQARADAGREREIIEKLDMVANLNDKFLQTLKEQMESNLGRQGELTKKLDEFLKTLTSFFAFQKKIDLERKVEEEASKPTADDLRY